ncbi:hypothetical protein FVE85_4834 [Porphyridium purpureum]|uniref:DUF1365 domain-containing protein n=1 Tax=Porphyridium purpureum TaxID=35688 RepID=A0A5J4YTB6_PORPP|nr:hypothetical protein FVE85_4834 [Porphyridium purpureum]|eukprot:POR6051..scf236_6
MTIAPGRRSRVVRGDVVHSRSSPQNYVFRYRVYMVVLDLDEVESGELDCWPVFSSRAHVPALSWFRRTDYFFGEVGKLYADPSGNLSESIRNYVQHTARSGERPRGRILLLTHLRTFGVGFNPVSFYYVMGDPQQGQDPEEVQYIVAEVGNIPWFEQHPYLLTRTDEAFDDRQAPSRTDAEDATAMVCYGGHEKRFHVSPFIPIEGVSYRWHFSSPVAPQLRVRTVLSQTIPQHACSASCSAGCAAVSAAAERFFVASLTTKDHVPFSALSMLKHQVMYPFMTSRVIFGIHFEAAKLFRRRFTCYSHPEGTETAASQAIAFVTDCTVRCTELLSSLLHLRTK